MLRHIVVFVYSVICFMLGAAAEYYSKPVWAITYEQQHQDKELCERDIKRSERCVPVMMWLPEAVQ